MLSTLRRALRNTTLGLTWDQLTQHPDRNNDTVSLLLIESADIGKALSTFTVRATAKHWANSVGTAETWFSEFASFLAHSLVKGLCAGSGLSVTGYSPINVEFAGIAEEAGYSNLESVILSADFTIQLTRAST